MGFSDLFKKRKNKDGNNNAGLNNAGVFKVNIPEERIISAKLTMQDKPYVGLFNEALLELTPQYVFGWFLSLVIQFNSTAENGMPNNEDTVKMQDFCDLLSEKLSIDRNHPNAVLLGKVTGNGQTQIMWYVNNPELANGYLQGLIASEEHPFHFDFEMNFDKDWEEAHFWLDPLVKK